MMMIKWVVAGKTSYQKYLNTWHLLLKVFCSKLLINATQNHKLVSARFFKSDNKKLHCLIPNNRDCHVGLTSCLKLILRMSSMTKYQINQGSSPVSPSFSITPCTMLNCHCPLNPHQNNRACAWPYPQCLKLLNSQCLLFWEQSWQIRGQGKKSRSMIL